MVVVQPFGPWGQHGPHRDTRAFLAVKSPHFYHTSTAPTSPRTRVPPLRARPAGPAGWYVYPVATYIPPSPLRIKEEPCADVRRPLHWAVRRSRSSGTLEPAGWRTHPMASPGGPSLEHTDPDRILTPARGVRSVTKAPRAESDRAEPAIRDLDHGYLCACSAWPREGPFSTSVTCQAFRRDRGPDCASRPAKASRIRIGCSRTWGRLTAPHNRCGVWPAAHILGQ